IYTHTRGPALEEDTGRRSRRPGRSRLSPEDLGSYRLHLRDMAGLPQEHARLPQQVCGASRHSYAFLLTPFFKPVPNFDPAIQTAFAYQEWVRELTRPVLLNQPAKDFAVATPASGLGD